MFGMEEAPMPLKKSLEYLVATVRNSSGVLALGNASLMDPNLQIDGATREKVSGHFPSVEGGDWAW